MRTHSVFEHGQLSIDKGDLREDEFRDLVRFNDRHGGCYFEVGHKHLRMKQFVGYLEAGDVAIEILPKADRHAPADQQVWREGLLEMLRIGGGLKLDRLPNASQKLTRRPLIELIAQAYLAEIEHLLREGLTKGYRTVTSNGSVFRGRLKIIDHIRANVARDDRFFVQFQSFDHNIAINRVLVKALEVLSWCALSPTLACQVEAAIARFPELDLGAPDAGAVDRIRLSRATYRYASALVYARMILEQQGPQLRLGRERVFALLFDMNTLWERYIAALVRRAAPTGIEVHTQEQHRFWEPRQHMVRKVRPDIVLRDASGHAVLVIDTKWKTPSSGLPSDDDLKQMFVYNELLACDHSMLLYPRVASSRQARGTYSGREHACSQEHVGVIQGQAWSTRSIQQELANLLVMNTAVRRGP